MHEDAAALAGMGVKQELQRNFSFLSMLGLAFAITQVLSKRSLNDPVSISVKLLPLDLRKVLADLVKNKILNRRL